MTRQAIPVTNPLRTLVDLGASVATDALAAAVDIGLATRLVTVDGLVAELSRLGRRGRPGPGPLRILLTDRGFIGVPHPSVLERATVGGAHLHLLVCTWRDITAEPARVTAQIASCYRRLSGLVA